MTIRERRLCPVCHCDVDQTKRGSIAQHFDSIRSGVCLGSGEPYWITVQLPEEEAS